MCGIAGIWAATADAPAVRRMLAAIAHRGPDGEGLWHGADGGPVLGHKRLAVIDPAGGAQPMGNEDGAIQVTFNGCIYNHRELTAELRALGHRFASRCDTEVIVHAYEQWGPDCVKRFNGMWAFALWDARQRRLICSRDRLGVKPFYYTWDGERFAFASEIKSLVAAGVIQPECDPDGLRQYLTLQFCLEDTTLFRGVRRLEPGCNLVLSTGSAPRLERYWELEFSPDLDHTERYFVDRLQWLLEDAVRLRLRADVPLGAHLSGGLDSSTLVALARRSLGEAKLHTFTGAFHAPGFDETAFARGMAKTAGTEHHEVFLEPEDFRDSLAQIVWHMDEPSAGPGVFPQYHVARLASQHVKVVLGGQGGDELFIGYARYLVAYLEESLRGAIEQTADTGQYVATLGTLVPSLPSLRNYIPMLKNFWREGLFEAPVNSYFRLMDRLADSRDLLDEGVLADRDRTFAEFSAVFEGHRGAAALINRILHFDLKTHLQALLHVEDRTSMAWGLESRTPLLDYRLVELMAAVPPVVKFKNGQLKHLFRTAVAEWVPREISTRTDKMGFPVPLAQWLAGPLREMAADILLSRRARQRGLYNVDALRRMLESPEPFGRGVWGALCLELWHQQFIDAAAPTHADVVRRAA